MAGKGGARPGSGNPGHGHNIRIMDLIGKSVDYCLRMMDRPDGDKEKHEIATKVVVKTVPSEMNFYDKTTGKKKGIQLSDGASAIIAKAIIEDLGRSAVIVDGEKPADLDSTQPDGEREE